MDIYITLKYIHLKNQFKNRKIIRQKQFIQHVLRRIFQSAPPIPEDMHVPEGPESPSEIPELKSKDSRELSIAVQEVQLT